MGSFTRTVSSVRGQCVKGEGVTRTGPCTGNRGEQLGPERLDPWRLQL